MTQPMGPLEEGDQALVDAAREIRETGEIPDGYGRINTGREVTRIGKKSKTLGQMVVHAEIHTPDGSTEQTTTALIRSMPGIGRISAETHDLSVDKNKRVSGLTSSYASGNEVRVGRSPLNMKPDRAKAQAIKLDAARRIKTAHEHYRYRQARR